jgi:hypothetical protein
MQVLQAQDLQAVCAHGIDVRMRRTRDVDIGYSGYFFAGRTEFGAGRADGPEDYYAAMEIKSSLALSRTKNAS